jgi:hypothetical protein
MPGSTKITDVIGEGNYFSINLIGNNPQISTVNYVESKGYVDFSIFPNKYCYITENEDFARFIAERKEIEVEQNIKNLGDKTIEEIMANNITGDNDSANQLDHMIGELVMDEMGLACEYYEEYYNITYDNKFGDANKYGLRDKPEGRNIYRNISAESDGNESDMFACAKVVISGIFDMDVDNASIIKWVVTHPESGWSQTLSGYIKKYEKVLVQLPYLGNYNVEVSVWDVYNHCCKQFTKDAIIVKPYNIDIRGFYLDARPLPDNLQYDLFIPQEYLENVERTYRYFIWSKNDGGHTTKGIVTRIEKASDMTLSDIIGEFIVDGVGLTNYRGLENLRDVDREHWIGIANTQNDSDDVLKISWMCNKKNNTYFGVDVFNFVRELNEDLEDIPFSENDTYVPEWHSDAIYHVIKNNVDKMYDGALIEHICDSDINSSMRNYRPDGSVSNEGPYYKFDVENILYKINRGFKEYDHLNNEIINLETGEHYKYVRYINNAVNIKPLTWVLLGFDQTRITGRIINNEYPEWTLTKIGDIFDPNEEMRNDKIITTHNGLYFTYLFEDEGIYKIKLKLLDINGNEYEIEKNIITVDKYANYEMYHTLNDEYNKYLEMKNDRSLIYLK